MQSDDCLIIAKTYKELLKRNEHAWIEILKKTWKLIFELHFLIIL